MIAVSLIMIVLGTIFGSGTGVISLFIQFTILAYAGYNGVKAFKLDISNGALAGATASFLSMVFTIISNIVFILIGVIPLEAMSHQAGVPVGAVSFYMGIGYCVGLIASPVLGFVLGAIGAYLARNK